MIDIDKYQKEALATAVYPNRGDNVVYPILGLCGETGELAEKLKKCLRDSGGVLSPDIKQTMLKELGDCLWYCAAIADELGHTLSSVAAINLEKVHGRRTRGTLHGSGDDR